MSAASGGMLDFARSVPIRLFWLITGWLPVRCATALGASLGAVS